MFRCQLPILSAIRRYSWGRRFHGRRCGEDLRAIDLVQCDEGRSGSVDALEALACVNARNG